MYTCICIYVCACVCVSVYICSVRILVNHKIDVGRLPVSSSSIAIHLIFKTTYLIKPRVHSLAGLDELNAPGTHLPPHPYFCPNTSVICADTATSGLRFNMCQHIHIHTFMESKTPVITISGQTVLIARHLKWQMLPFSNTPILAWPFFWFVCSPFCFWVYDDPIKGSP